MTSVTGWASTVERGFGRDVRVIFARENSLVEVTAQLAADTVVIRVVGTFAPPDADAGSEAGDVPLADAPKIHTFAARLAGFVVIAHDGEALELVQVGAESGCRVLSSSDAGVLEVNFVDADSVVRFRASLEDGVIRTSVQEIQFAAGLPDLEKVLNLAVLQLPRPDQGAVRGRKDSSTTIPAARCRHLLMEGVAHQMMMQLTSMMAMTYQGKRSGDRTRKRRATGYLSRRPNHSRTSPLLLDRTMTPKTKLSQRVRTLEPTIRTHRLRIRRLGAAPLRPRGSVFRPRAVELVHLLKTKTRQIRRTKKQPLPRRDLRRLRTRRTVRVAKVAVTAAGLRTAIPGMGTPTRVGRTTVRGAGVPTTKEMAGMTHKARTAKDRAEGTGRENE